MSFVNDQIENFKQHNRGLSHPPVIECLERGDGWALYLRVCQGYQSVLFAWRHMKMPMCRNYFAERDCKEALQKLDVKYKQLGLYLDSSLR